MELARGQVADRPWGQTLGALGLRQLSGQLTLHGSDGRLYEVAFERGAVVGATSPLANDSAARVALTNHLITSSQVSHVARQVAANPELDELDVLAHAVQLDADRALRLRQRVIAQRAARTFAIEAGDFTVVDQITIPVARAAAVDIRAVVYLGVKMNLSEQRLAADLRQLGSHFKLKPDAVEDLTQFGLTNTERPIVDALRAGTTLPELEALHRDLDPRSMHSVVYALVSCFACDATLPLPPLQLDFEEHSFQPIVARSAASPSAVEGLFIKSQPRTSTMDRPRTSTMDRPRTTTIDREPRTAIGTGSVPRTNTPTLTPRTTTVDPQMTRTRTLTDPGRTRMPTDPVRSRVPYDDGVTRPRAATPTNDPFERPVMLTERAERAERETGQQPTIARTPSIAVGRTPSPPATPTLPRAGSPTTPASRTPSEPRLPIPGRTQTPLPSMPRTKSPSEPRTTTDRNAFVLEEPSGDQRVVDPLAQAAEAYQKGQSALRDDQVQLAIEELTKATELNPHEFDYAATLAWAQFCGAPDRNRIAEKVRKMLNHAIQKSKNPELARFYLGRMERMLGRDREALRHFQMVLDEQPRNADAASEVRQLEARLASGSGEKPGLSGLFSRKKP